MKKVFFFIKSTSINNWLKGAKQLKKSIKVKSIQFNLFKKYLIFSKLTKASLLVKKTLKYLRLFFSKLMLIQKQTLPHIFKKKTKLLTWTQYPKPHKKLKLFKIIFFKSELFTPIKTKNTSRLKRKIYRKLIKNSTLEF